MEILPTTLGTRPGLACEVRPEGVVAARRGDGAAMAALARAMLPEGAFRPGLRVGGVVDRVAVVTALRQALEKVVDRSRVLTLIVPDASVRVLLLDFDALPGKAAEALPVVRFRLKKLLPFDADDAAISYQVMSMSRSAVRVVAVAMPRDVLGEFESIVREAGFEPGAVLPSTLAVLAGLAETDAPALVINAGLEAVTAAIVRGGLLLLHRSVDMRVEAPTEARLEAVTQPAIPAELLASPLLDHGTADPLASMAAVRIGGTALLEQPAQSPAERLGEQESDGQEFGGQEFLLQELLPAPQLAASEIVQAVSVAAAYFEDTLGAPPDVLLAAGPLSAAQMSAMLDGTPLEGWTVEETTDPAGMPPGQGPAGMPGAIPRGWLAGVQGALRG